MRSDYWLRPAGWLGMVGGVLLSGALVQAQQFDAGQAEGQFEVRVLAPPPGQQGDVLFFVDGAEPAPPVQDPNGVFVFQPAQPGVTAVPDGGQVLLPTPLPLSDYWIGLACDASALNSTVRAQLGLSEEQGLAVASVVPDSPAAEAGFQDHDILLSAGDKSLTGVADLIAAVDAAKESELSIELVRGGKRLSIKVTPAKRPEEMRPDHAAQHTALQQWIARLPDGGQSIRLAVVPQPGVLMPQGAAPFVDFPQPPALPEGTTVVITKSGAQPATVAVERGDERFEITEDKLAELPEDLRGPVGAMLGQHPYRIRVRGVEIPVPVVQDPQQFLPPNATPQPPPPQPARRVIVQPFPPQPGQPVLDPLQQIMERLDALQKAVEALQAAQQPAPPTDQPAAQPQP